MWDITNKDEHVHTDAPHCWSPYSYDYQTHKSYDFCFALAGYEESGLGVDNRPSPFGWALLVSGAVGGGRGAAIGGDGDSAGGRAGGAAASDAASAAAPVLVLRVFAHWCIILRVLAILEHCYWK